LPGWILEGGAAKVNSMDRNPNLNGKHGGGEKESPRLGSNCDGGGWAISEKKSSKKNWSRDLLLEKRSPMREGGGRCDY